MKKQNKTLAVLLAAAILIGCTGTALYAMNRGQNVQAADPVKEEAPAAEAAAAPEEGTNDETVYVLAGSDGTVKKVIVSDWIKDGLDTYAVGGEDMQVWDAQGNALPYPGDPEEELPVALSMSYTLDGSPISAQELAGKSGHVTIRFDYENRQKKTVTIDGRETEMNVPFAMLTGMMLDKDSFRNVQVTNGKMADDGKRITVVGFAFPGLQENLALDSDLLELPDYVEISADTTNFTMGMTVSVATDELFAELDDEKLDAYDDLKDSLGALTDAMGQLTDGSSQLYDGLAILLDKSGELVSGLDQLAIGARALKDGALALNDGAGKINIGTIQLDLGQSRLCANNDTLNGGAKQIFEALLSEAEGQLTKAGLSVPHLTMKNYASALTEAAASLDAEKVRTQALQTVTEAVEANRPAVEQAVTAAVREQVSAKVTAAVREQVAAQVTAAIREQVTAQVTPAVQSQVEAQVTQLVRANVQAQAIAAALSGMSLEDYEKAVASGTLDSRTQTAIEQAVDAQMNTPEIAAQITQTTAEQMNTAEVHAQLAAVIEQQMAAEAVITQLENTVGAQMAAEDIAAKISDNTDAQMKTQDVLDTIRTNTDAQIEALISQQMESDEVQARLTQAAEGAKTIASLKTSLDSFQSFYQGLGDYTSGVSTAAQGTKTLSIGTAALKDAASQLSAGAVSLYQGILQMRNGAPALVDGVSQLKDGSLQLSDGLRKFDSEGIQKLVDAADGSLGTLVARLKATIDISRSYRSFHDLADNSVKFIYRTDEIE